MPMPLLLLLIPLLMLCGTARAATYAFQSDTFAWESASNNVVWEQSNTSYPERRRQEEHQLYRRLHLQVRRSRLQRGAHPFQRRAAVRRRQRIPSGFTTNTNLPNSGHDRLILMYWDDINPRTGGTVRYQQKGSAPNRYFVVSWDKRAALQPGRHLYVPGHPVRERRFQVPVRCRQRRRRQRHHRRRESSNSDYTLYSFNNAFGTSGTAIRWTRDSAPVRRVSAHLRLRGQRLERRFAGGVRPLRQRAPWPPRRQRPDHRQAARVCQGASIPEQHHCSGQHDAVNTAFDLDATLGAKGAVSFWYKQQRRPWSGSGSAQGAVAGCQYWRTTSGSS
jgi:MSHA biogenesis protein MshQ